MAQKSKVDTVKADEILKETKESNPVVEEKAQVSNDKVSRVIDALEMKIVELEAKIDEMKAISALDNQLIEQQAQRITTVEKKCGIGVVPEPYEQRTTLPDGIPSGGDIIDDKEMQKHIIRRI